MNTNVFKRFEDLTGRPLRTVGTCVAADFGECTIQYPGGSRVTVQGVGTVGQDYFVLNGRLDGDAPALTALTVEV